MLAQRQEQLGLFDGVDPQVGLQVQVEVQHFDRVAGLFGDLGEDEGFNILIRWEMARRMQGLRRAQVDLSPLDCPFPRRFVAL